MVQLDKILIKNNKKMLTKKSKSYIIHPIKVKTHYVLNQY